jgi:CRP-like cAMP-binding protein
MLASLASDIQAEIASAAEDLTLSAGEVLHSNVGVAVGSVYFPHSGVISVRSNYSCGAQVEVAAVGNRGAFGLFSLLGVPLQSMVAEVTIETHATRLPLPDFRRIYAESAPVRTMVAKFLASLFNEVVQSVGCYRFHTHDQWVARWLLTMADKAGTDTLAVTHDLIARRIGSQRHAVSTSMGQLRNASAIRSERGIVSIVDRARLRTLSCDCYRAVSPDGDIQPSSHAAVTHPADADRPR